MYLILLVTAYAFSTAAAVTLLEDITAEGICSTPPLSNSLCGFYPTCLERHFPCGFDGYALGYGDKYCHRFNADDTGLCLDDAGDEWVKSTTACLQNQLVAIVEQDVKELNCRYIKTTAFDSHPLCYTGGGEIEPVGPSICFLPLSDWKCVLATVDPKDLLTPLGIQQELRIAAICLEQLVAAGICSTERPQNEDERCAYWSELMKL